MTTPADTAPVFQVGFDPARREPWDLTALPEALPAGASVRIAFPALTMDLVRGTIDGHTLALRGTVGEPGMTIGPLGAPMPKADFVEALVAIEGHCRRLVRQLEATMAERPPLVTLADPTTPTRRPGR